MNELSTRLFNALRYPILQDIRNSETNNPSTASIKVVGEHERIVGACLRALYYKRMGFIGVSEINPDWALAATIGNSLHSLLENLIDQFGVLMKLQKISSEHSFYDPFHNISGRSDLIVWDQKSNTPIGIEIKSVGDWKSSQCLSKPAEEHILQCMIYLDYYRRAIPEGQLRPTKWYIWYIARSENWNLKAKKHFSPLTQLWDFTVSLSEEGNPIIGTPEGTEIYHHLSLSGIYSRFTELEAYISSNRLPPRDYSILYTEEELVGRNKRGLLSKTDSAKVDKWIAKGSPKGELDLSIGDFECRVCEHQSECWKIPKNEDSKTYRFPNEESITKLDNLNQIFV